MEKIRNNQSNQKFITMLGQKTGSALDIKTNEDFNKQLPVDNSGLMNVYPIDDGHAINDYNQTAESVMSETISDNIEAVKSYTCSMHPEVISDKPGKCPKCGMELVEKK